MSSFSDIRIFYKSYYGNDKGKSEIANRYPDKGLAYTCHCGWIDAGHARPKGAIGLWRDILNESNKYKQNGMDGYKISYAQNAAAWGITFNKSGNYFIKSGLSNLEKEKVALAIFQEISLGFETNQREGIKGFLSENLGTGSSFSAEDLVSNIVGFYHAVRGTRWQDHCGIVSREAAEKVWNENGAIGAKKNFGFLPRRFKCDECSDYSLTPLQFQIYYQTIYPISKGIWHFDFDETNASPVLSRQDKNFQDFLFKGNRGNFGFGFLDVPKTVKLTVNDGETEYFFCRRALIQAAFLAGLTLTEQMNYADAFYPLSIGFKEMNSLKLNWISGDPSNDNDKTIKPNEFRDLYGNEFTFHLSEEHIKELRARKANRFSPLPFRNNF